MLGVTKDQLVVPRTQNCESAASGDGTRNKELKEERKERDELVPN